MVFLCTFAKLLLFHRHVLIRLSWLNFILHDMHMEKLRETMHNNPTNPKISIKLHAQGKSVSEAFLPLDESHFAPKMKFQKELLQFLNFHDSQLDTDILTK